MWFSTVLGSEEPRRKKTNAAKDGSSSSRFAPNANGFQARECTSTHAVICCRFLGAFAESTLNSRPLLLSKTRIAWGSTRAERSKAPHTCAANRCASSLAGSIASRAWAGHFDNRSPFHGYDGERSTTTG